MGSSLDKDYPMEVSIRCGDKIYEGMLHTYESYNNSPHLVISSYIIKDTKTNTVLENNLKVRKISAL